MADVRDLFLGVLATRTADLRSPLTRGEVEQRIESAIDSRWKPFGSRPVIGVVRDSRVWFRARPGRTRHPFQTVMHAQFVDEGSSTLIRGRSGMAPAGIMFLVAFIGVAVALLLFTTAIALTGQLEGRGPPPWNWLPPIGALTMIVVGVAMGVVGRYLARHEHDFLVDFLAETTGADILAR